MKNERTNNQTAADAIDLRHYIKTINGDAKGGFLLTDDLDHWAEYGIYTKAQLGDYLDECVQKEYDADNIVEDEVVYYDAPEPTWDAVSRHDSNEGW